MANAPLSLNFAVADYPHTRAILSGRIPIEGIAPNFIKVEPQIAAYRRMVRNVEFDVCEIAPTTYIMARALGAPFVALPIFVSRGFHHGGLLVRPDANIHNPKDLEGKKVGVRAYSVIEQGRIENGQGRGVARFHAHLSVQVLSVLDQRG